MSMSVSSTVVVLHHLFSVVFLMVFSSVVAFVIGIFSWRAPLEVHVEFVLGQSSTVTCTKLTYGCTVE